MYNTSTVEFAIIQTGGKQYAVSKGDEITVEKIIGLHKEGDPILFDKVLLVDDGKNTVIGAPFIPKTGVKATISKIGRAPKIIVTHYRQKSRYWKRNSHRQPFFKVKIDGLK